MIPVQRFHPDESRTQVSDEVRIMFSEALIAGGAIVGLYDPEDRLVFASPGLVDLVGLPPDALTFADVMRHSYLTRTAMLIETDDLDAWLAAAARRRRSAPHRGFQVDFVDGRWFWVEETCWNGGWLLFRMLDITQLKADEQSIQAGRALAAHRTEMLALSEQFETSVRSVARAVAAAAKQVNGASDELAVAAQGTSASAAAAIDSALDAHSVAGRVADAVSSFSSSIESIAQSIDSQSAMTEAALAASAAGGNAVRDLARRANSIVGFLERIERLASQSRLLALNASIEAARSGEAGKGFSVVAGEVKLLANRTAEVTTDIRQLVEAIAADTRTATASMDAVLGTVADLRQASGDIGGSVALQRASVLSLDASASRAVRIAEEVGAEMDQVRSAADASALCSRQLRESADHLLAHASGLDAATSVFVERLNTP